MTFEEKYEAIISSFIGRRRELLNMMASVVPSATEMHRREWRVQQLENAIYDIKETFAACNLQLEQERDILDELSNENERLVAQERKLIEDIKLLEGVTGMQAVIPCDAHTGLMKEITEMSEEFRNNFADFYFNLPQLKQELQPDPTLEKDGHILISTLRDYVTLQFSHRASNASFSKLADERVLEADHMERTLGDDIMRIEREIENARRSIEDDAGKAKGALLAQTKEIRDAGKERINKLKKLTDELEAKVEAAKNRKSRLKMRYQNLVTQNQSLKESYRRRAREIELELDKIENHLEVLRKAPGLADDKLVNISLVLNDNTKKINKAIARMRSEISEFNDWLRT